MWSLWVAAKATRDALTAEATLATEEKALLADCNRIVDRLSMEAK